MAKLLTVSLSPHAYNKKPVSRLMLGVIYALIPAYAVSIYYFGMGAIVVSLVSVFSCILFEYLAQKFLLKIKPSISDGSAIVTGMLLAFNLPSNLPIWLVVMGAFVSIGIGKMTFGGLGNNPFNPALVGRVFLLVSFPVQMTSWPKGFSTSYSDAIDAITGETPLGIVKEGIKNGESVNSLLEKVPDYINLFLGQMNGSMGEISAIALLLGLIYMLRRKIITIHVPLSILATMFLFTGILWMVNPEKYIDPIFHLLTGGILLGAIFMATDYVTSPMTTAGMWIFGIGIGVITVIIRVFGAYPEGVSFAILIMNAFVPLINEYFPPKRFGEEVKNG